ncbi:MAG: exonuclease domain-containing protein [Labilithrix sp.]|nr:exonuclease domain-containing protein [Labilithrix sp.]
MESFPYWLVIDLEATCDDRDGPCLVPKHEMETIEIGAVLVDAATLETVGELGQMVRPVRHPALTEFCKALTTIRQEDVDRAPLFPEAVASVERLLDGRRALFCSWGDYDRNQLAQDAAHHRIRVPFAHTHVNLKKRFSEALGLPKRYGMDGALGRVGLTLEGTHHRGIDDARNIARLLPWITGRRRIDGAIGRSPPGSR